MLFNTRSGCVINEMEDWTDSDREQVFHNTVREYIIFLLLFILLYISSYVIISKFKRLERDEYYPGDDEEAKVYRISLWICTFSLAVSVGAALLLPISIMSNEILLFYPKSYYVKWLNSSLIQGLWNHVFLFSNLCLFILLPFAYLFTESEGFPGSTKGLTARVYETFVVLALLSTLVLGMTYIISAMIDKDKSSLDSLFNVWNYYLPFLYSCVSFLGVLLLLLCTPLGFARLYTVVGTLIVRPQLLGDINEECFIVSLEEDALQRKLASPKNSGVSYSLCNGSDLRSQLLAIEHEKKRLERRRRATALQRNFAYPTVIILLLVLMTIVMLMVCHNTLQLLSGFKALPISTQQFTLGITSLSVLGPIGSMLEIVLILYLILTSLVGLYTVPIFSKIRPKPRNTPMTHMLGNCVILLGLSSAVPLLSRTLGITNFDLLGDFGRIEWLGNFYIVLFYNVIFAVAVALSLSATSFVAIVRRKFFSLFLQSWFASTSLHSKND